MPSAPQPAPESWQAFFDEDYARLWQDAFTPDDNRAQVDALWALLQLREGSRVLDAACGYGRLSRPLAERGATVVGVDQSAALLALAERERGELPASRLRYVRHDLRQSLQEAGFDAAMNVFTSIGFGEEADDLAIFTTLHAAVRPGGLVLVEAIQRDAVAAFFATGGHMARRRPDGTLVMEEMSFDPIAARMVGTWYWSGPHGSGAKTATLRIYTAGELIAMLERVGLRFVSAHAGVSAAPFKGAGPQMGGRIGLLARRHG